MQRINGVPSCTILAIDPHVKGDWLAPEPANYVATRDHLMSRGQTVFCRYGYLGDAFLGNTADNSWKSIVSRKPNYVVTVDPNIYPSSEQWINQALKPLNFGIFFNNLNGSGLFSLVGPLRSDSGILVYRYVDYLKDGRRFSDRGEHAAAIASLEKATQVEPGNTEAWANLQLALLRNGENERSIQAGDGAWIWLPPIIMCSHTSGWHMSILGRSTKLSHSFKRHLRTLLMMDIARRLWRGLRAHMSRLIAFLKRANVFMMPTIWGARIVCSNKFSSLVVNEPAGSDHPGTG